MEVLPSGQRACVWSNHSLSIMLPEEGSSAPYIQIRGDSFELTQLTDLNKTRHVSLYDPDNSDVRTCQLYNIIHCIYGRSLIFSSSV